MNLGVKELIEVKSEISLGVSCWNPPSTKLANPLAAATHWDHRRIASVFITGWPTTLLIETNRDCFLVIKENKLTAYLAQIA
jgi:hypothetical protein